MRFPQPGTFGPGIAWQVISAEYLIDEREDGGKILSVIPGILAVVPVVVLRRGKNIFQETEVDTCVGMNKHGMNGHENNVRIESDLREAENVQRNKGHGTGDKDVHKMRS